MNVRCVLATLTAVSGAAAAAFPLAPAHALVVPTMRVEVYGEGTSTFRACGYGSAGSTLQWTLTVEGIRVAGAPITGTRTTTATSVTDFCIDIPKVTSAGAGTATWSFIGIGTDVAGTFVGYYRWGGGLPDDAGGSGIT